MCIAIPALAASLEKCNERTNERTFGWLVTAKYSICQVSAFEFGNLDDAEEVPG